MVKEASESVENKSPPILPSPFLTNLPMPLVGGGVRQSLGSFQGSRRVESGHGGRHGREAHTLPVEKKSLKASWKRRHEAWAARG